MVVSLATPTKQCPWCHRDLPATNAYFARNAGPYYPDGLYYVCKECKKTRSGSSSRARTHREAEQPGPRPPRRVVGSLPALEAEIARRGDALALARAAYADGHQMPGFVWTWIQDQEAEIARLWEQKRALRAQARQDA